MRVAKDCDLTHRRVLVHIRQNFTNAARVVNAGNVAMIRSEIVLRVAVHAYVHPLTLLDSTLIVEPCPEGPKETHARPHRILFSVTLALDSGLWTDTGWRLETQ